MPYALAFTIAALLGGSIISPLAAQVAVIPTTQPPPKPGDVATLDGIMKAYYDVVSGPVGSLPDPTRDQSLHHPNAQVTLLDRKADRTATVAVITLADYYRRGGLGPRKRGFFEHEIHRVTERIGSLAHVWSTYESAETPGGKSFSRGINSIQLYWDGHRWWVLGWVFDDERAGNRIPPEYLPTPH